MLAKLVHTLAAGRLRGMLGALGFAALCACGLASGYFDEARQTYASRVAETYNYRFGRSEPFLPSTAKIEGGTFIQAGAFPTAQYCRGCHGSVYHEWRQSLHANSFRTPFYTKNVGLLQTPKGSNVLGIAKAVTTQFNCSLVW